MGATLSSLTYGSTGNGVWIGPGLGDILEICVPGFSSTLSLPKSAISPGSTAPSVAPPLATPSGTRSSLAISRTCSTSFPRSGTGTFPRRTFHIRSRSTMAVRKFGWIGSRGGCACQYPRGLWR